MSKKRQSYLAVAVALLAALLPLLGCSRGPEENATPQAAPAVEGVQRQVFCVEGMTCEGCVRTVTAAIQEVPGVTDVEVSLKAGQAVVVGNPEKVSAQAVIAAIEKAGCEASLADGGNEVIADEKS